MKVEYRGRLTISKLISEGIEDIYKLCNSCTSMENVLFVESFVPGSTGGEEAYTNWTIMMLKTVENSKKSSNIVDYERMKTVSYRIIFDSTLFKIAMWVEPLSPNMYTWDSHSLQEGEEASCTSTHAHIRVTLLAGREIIKIRLISLNTTRVEIWNSHLRFLVKDRPPGFIVEEGGQLSVKKKNVVPAFGKL